MAQRKPKELNVTERFFKREEIDIITPFGVYLKCISSDFKVECRNQKFKDYMIPLVEKMWTVST